MVEDRATKCSCRCDDQYERVIWLTYPAKRINAFKDFEALSDINKRRFWKRFEYWTGGFPPNKEKHHGWDAPYKGCYVFKSDKHRLYGFLFRSPYGRNSELCVVCIHAMKNEDNTNRTILDRLNEYQNDETIINAVLALKKRKDLL